MNKHLIFMKTFIIDIKLLFFFVFFIELYELFVRWIENSKTSLMQYDPEQINSLNVFHKFQK